MSDHATIVRAIQFMERYGYVLLFVWVLAEQCAIPLPSAPLLIVAGALIHAGDLDFMTAIICCVLGALLADSVWFELGKYRGRQILRLVCRLSLEPDSCVRQTENAFLKYGLRSLLVSKFIPGLNTLAAPSAARSGTPYFRFLLYDAAGSLVWSGVYIFLGYLFNEQLETIIGYASRTGLSLLLLIAVLFAGWIAWKWTQRRRFLKHLELARITPDELRRMLTAGENPCIVDVRSGLLNESALVAGVIRVSLENLAASAAQIPRDREIVLFCS